MKKLFIALLALLIPMTAFAGGNELAYVKVQELPELASSSVATGDYVVVYDTSSGKVKKVLASGLPFVGATAGAGSFTTLATSSTSSLGDDVTIANGKAIKTDTTTAHTMVLQAYDVDGTAYKTFGTYTNGNTPSYALSAPSGGTISIDGAVIGGTTAAAGTFTTMQANTSLKVNATNGTAITQIIIASDAVASGQTSKTVTVTGATSSSKCFAAPAEVATNSVYIRAVVPGTNQAVVTTSGDPGASNLDIQVICYN